MVSLCLLFIYLFHILELIIGNKWPTSFKFFFILDSSRKETISIIYATHKFKAFSCFNPLIFFTFSLIY